jgi:hypothetical protein
MAAFCQIGLMMLTIIPPQNVCGSGSTPYEVKGSLGDYEAVHYWITDVNVNDLVLISISPDQDAYFYSEVSYPNMTKAASIQQVLYEGSHSYEFLAKEAGNYVLKIWGYLSLHSHMNFTIRCSHKIPNGDALLATPYSKTGEMEDFGVVFETIYNINKDEPVLISISPDRGAGFYSEVLYPNMTKAASIQEIMYEGSHSYEFLAKEAGNYVLKIWGYWAYSHMNYTLRCSHSLSSGPDFSLTPSSNQLRVEIGSTSRIDITIRSLYGFSSDVYLVSTNVPAGVSVSFEPTSVNVPPDEQTGSIMVVKVDSSARTGMTALSVVGSDGKVSRSCTVKLAVMQVLVASSITCSLNSSHITYTEKTLVSGLLDPPLSTGTTRFRSSHDNVTWGDISSGVPIQGRTDFVWMPDVGTHFIRAEWSGDEGHRACLSAIRVLVVEKKPTIIRLELSRDEIRPGEGVTLSTEMLPALDSQRVSIQYTYGEGNWQSLASGITDGSGRFSYKWVPSSSGVFLLRSTWSGSENFHASVSETRALIVTSASTTTRITVSNTTIKSEIGVIKSLSFSVLDPNSVVVNTGAKLLDTSAVGPFNVLITFQGNGTYKPSYLNVKYTITPVATKIGNVLIKAEYSPNPIEWWIEQIVHRDKENKIYQQTYTYVEFEVIEVKTNISIDRSSFVIDTSKVGINKVELSYEGSQTHAAASMLVEYTVLDRVTTPTILAASISLIGILLTIGGIINRLRKKQKQNTTLT